MSTLFRRLLPLGFLLPLCACDDTGGGDGFEVQAIAERTRGNAPLRVSFRTRTDGPLDAAKEAVGALAAIATPILSFRSVMTIFAASSMTVPPDRSAQQPDF